MRFKDELLSGNWGTVRIGGRPFAMRFIVFVLSVALWLLALVVNTGSVGLATLWQYAVFLALMLLLASATRTIPVWSLVRMFFVGAFLMGVMVLLSRLFELYEPNKYAPLRDFVVPPTEETLKILPILWILWRGRRFDNFRLGATDVWLMVLFTAAGFGLLENAYVVLNSRPRANVAGVPYTDVVGSHLTAGQLVWSGAPAVGFALGLLLRGRPRVALPLAASGFALSVLDHIANNYFAVHPGALANLLRVLTIDGWLVLTLAVIGALVVLLADLYVVYGTLPPLPELQRPTGLRVVREWWTFVLARRALAYAVFQYRMCSGLTRARAICSAALLDAWFVNVQWFYRSGTSPRPERATLAGA